MMRQAVLLLSAIVLIFALSVPSNGQYQIPMSVIGGGGGSTSGGSYSLLGTVGQPTIGVVSGASYINEIGFWYQPGWKCPGR